MVFCLQRFAELRPYVYHLTATDNLGRIRDLRRLDSAELLLNQADQSALLHQRRPSHHAITIDGDTVILRDQAPLHEGNMALEPGWTFPQVVAMLNQRVFFWPGTASGPNDNGLRHHGRYEAEQPAVLRMRTQSILRANPKAPPYFCRYNSGSPRCSGGIKSPRGAATFQSAGETGFPPGKVVEVTFVGHVHLPDDTELRGATWEKWGALFATVAATQAEQGHPAAGAPRRR